MIPITKLQGFSEVVRSLTHTLSMGLPLYLIFLFLRKHSYTYSKSYFPCLYFLFGEKKKRKLLIFICITYSLPIFIRGYRLAW
uniref:Uncharacterized protein n=1 Tax=Octopus bimaculoides TaxID=37653 RepID=A0A0L8G4W7_OCTBM